MKSRSGDKIKLTSIDELLGVVNEESAMEIEIRKIHSFAEHPFKVMDDEKMDEPAAGIDSVWRYAAERLQRTGHRGGRPDRHRRRAAERICLRTGDPSRR